MDSIIMFVVMKLCKFDFLTNLNVPVEYKGNEIGFLPVFDSREKALKVYPDGQLVEVALKNNETKTKYYDS